jgi:hypothetical protein
LTLRIFAVIISKVFRSIKCWPSTQFTFIRTKSGLRD